MMRHSYRVRTLRRAAVATLAALGLSAPPRAGAQATTIARRLTLEDAVAIAQKQSLAILAATQQLAMATWADRAFSGSLRPGLTLTGTAFSLEHGINQVTQNDGTIRFLGQSNNQSNVALSVSQPLLLTGGTVTVSSGLSRTDEFGTLTRRTWQSQPVIVALTQPLFQPRELLWNKREQDAATNLAHSQFLEARETVAQDAATAFFALYSADVAMRNAAGNASISDTLVRVNRQRYQSAAIGQRELSQSELASLRARIAFENAKVARDHAEATLVRTLGLPVGEAIEVAPPEEIPRFTVDPALAVDAALRNGTSRDRIAVDSVTAARQVASARSTNGLNATLTAGVGFNQTADALRPAYQSPLGRQSVRLGLQLPLADWGVGHAETERARAAQEYAATQARITRAQVAEDARFAALDVTQAIRALELSARADTVAATQFAIARAQYAAGTLSLTDYLLAQQDKDAGVLEHVQALQTFWTRYYVLRKTTLFDFVKGERLDQ